MTQGISSQFIDQLWETTCVAVPVDGTLSRRPSFFVPLLLATASDLPDLQVALNTLGAELAKPAFLTPVAAPTVAAMLTWAADATALCATGDIRTQIDALAAAFNQPPLTDDVLEDLSDLATNATAQANAIEVNAMWALVPTPAPTNLQLVNGSLVAAANATAAMVVDVDNLCKVVNNGNVIDITTAESASASAAAVVDAVLAWANANAGGAPVAIVAGPFANLQAFRVAQGIP